MIFVLLDCFFEKGYSLNACFFICSDRVDLCAFDLSSIGRAGQATGIVHTVQADIAYEQFGQDNGIHQPSS
jgi:hypothetical protein